MKIEFRAVTRLRITDPHNITPRGKEPGATGERLVKRTIEITYGGGKVQRLDLYAPGTAGLMTTRERPAQEEAESDQG